MNRAVRKAAVSRKTSETDIRVALTIDGKGKSKVNTGIPFLNHMLELFAKHGCFDLDVTAKGDLDVDIHHTNEDVGICLGQALEKALGTKSGIRRYGSFVVPMDESLAAVYVDISGRASLNLSKGKGVRFSRLDRYTFHDCREFLRALCLKAGVTMHVEVRTGADTHHIIEAVFKALGRALDAATQRDERVRGIPSTKGVL